MASRQPFTRSWDDYFIPGTSVLRNKFTGPGKPYGETDPAKLAALEEQRTRLRLTELRTSPLPGRVDYDHMKAIHGYVFQDVYEWAGQERTAPTDRMMTKDGHAYYPAGPALTAAAEAEDAKLAGVLGKAITQPPPSLGRGSGDGPTHGPSQGPALRAASFPQAPSVTTRSTTAHPQAMTARAARQTGSSGPQTGRG